MHSTHKKPLYRKVNTRAKGVHHHFGDDFRHSRKKKHPQHMQKGIERGLDYTPLFRFLLSKVGSPWDSVYSEAVSRLDQQAPIFWLVSKDRESANDIVRIGESSYFSGLYIDHDNTLKIVAPEITENSFSPLCRCCTHTFNSRLCTKKYKQDI